MHEFETFSYLDVQKTASSFIIVFLRQFCKEKELKSKQHTGILRDYVPDKLHFISVRNPLSQYLSLYSYGCKCDGQLFTQLHDEGVSGLYDGTWSGFESWLEFVLDPKNAHLLGQGYGKPRTRTLSNFVGFQSYRVLLLALPNARTLLEHCETREEILQTYRANKLFDCVVYTETLRSDLAKLVETSLRGSMTDLTAALKFLRTEPPRNSSDRIDRYELDPRLDTKLRDILEKREWLLYEEFGYRSRPGRMVSGAHSVPPPKVAEQNDLATRVRLAELRVKHAEAELRFISAMAKWRELKVEKRAQIKSNRKKRGISKKSIREQRLRSRLRDGGTDNEPVRANSGES